MKKIAFALVSPFCFRSTGNGYVLEGQRLFFSPVSIQMNLSDTDSRLQSQPNFPLVDGAASWESVYFASTTIWNQYLANLQLMTMTGGNPKGGMSDDSVNEAFFGSSLGGSTLDSKTLALTV
jgi:hypothetical protein